MAKNKKPGTSLQSSLLGISHAHFLLSGLFAISIVISDAWNLIPPSVVLQRWTLVSLLLATTAGIWYASRLTTSTTLQKTFVWLYVLVDIAIATVLVFSQRGMASKSVVLFMIPLLVVAVLRSRAAIITTAALSTAAYSLAVVRYFVTSPGEGYKVELYTEILFYSGLFFVTGLLVWVASQSRDA